MAEIAFEDGRGITAVRMKRYAAHDWSADPTNLLIVSPTGGGKTYLACALGIAACHNGHSVTYARMDDLARRLVIARTDGIAHQELLNELSDTTLLIIDDDQLRDVQLAGQGGGGYCASVDSASAAHYHRPGRHHRVGGGNQHPALSA